MQSFFCKSTIFDVFFAFLADETEDINANKILIFVPYNYTDYMICIRICCFSAFLTDGTADAYAIHLIYNIFKLDFLFFFTLYNLHQLYWIDDIVPCNLMHDSW